LAHGLRYIFVSCERLVNPKLIDYLIIGGSSDREWWHLVRMKLKFGVRSAMPIKYVTPCPQAAVKGYGVLF
jgi:hypothetical protein